MNYPSLSDETLLLLIARDQTEALSELYRRYNRLIYSLAVAVVSDPHSAEEVTLDVFTRVWQKADTYQPDRAGVRTWLSRITRNLALNVVRRRNVRLDARSLRWADVTPPPIPTEHQPESMAELAQAQARVRAAIRELPPEQQEALALAYFGGYSHQQIADELDYPLGTVKTRIRSAMKKLRHLLQDELDLPPET
ncbi:MAG: sigma-70 family RNA polymerase sigma factor [Anaerolineae bacterium]